MAKNLNMSLLLDFYGEVLTEPQREAMDYFYNGDLSLSEIAEITGITRQGVRDRIVKGEQTVSQLEEKLGLAGRFGNVTKTVSYVVERLEALKESHGIDVTDILEAVKSLDA